MFAKELGCTGCGKAHGLKALYACDACGGSLEVKYDYGAIFKKEIADLLPAPGLNLWRYRSLLPIANEKAMVTLFEGGTPLVESPALAGHMGMDRLYLKDETRNPSGAFKDRLMAVGVAKAIELGFTHVVTASSGNGAASLAAYAAKARLSCTVFIPENTPMAKVAQARVSGAKVIKVRGDYSNSFRVAREVSTEPSCMNLTTTFLNPYAVEGCKTVAYEIFLQAAGEAPDWILVPTGAGPLLYGIKRGFEEIAQLGLTTKVPRLVAVQAAGCRPIEEAYRLNSPVRSWPKAETVASAISDPLRGYEKDGERVLTTLRSCSGLAVAVNDQEIIEAVRLLAEKEGVFSEPGGAAAVAALKMLVRAGKIRREEKVVCVVTGHGLKDPIAAIGDTDVETIEPDVADAFRKMRVSKDTE